MISILLPTYNEPIDLIKKSIESMQHQTYTEIELIVIVDNPNRIELIKELEKIKNGDGRIRIIKNKKNIGLTASLNEGVGRAKGDFIARMDADDISLPTRLEKQLRYLRENDYDLVGCNIANIDEEGEITRPKVTFPYKDDEVTKMLRFNSAIPHPTWLGRAKVFKLNPYVDYPACEDYELLTRLSINKFRMGNVPEVLFLYRNNSNGISFNKKAIQKTGLSYIRKKYRKGKGSNIDDYLEFLKTKKAQKIIKQNDSYFKFVDEYKNQKGKNNKIKILIKNMPKLLNKSAAENIYCTLRTRIIRKKMEG